MIAPTPTKNPCKTAEIENSSTQEYFGRVFLLVETNENSIFKPFSIIQEASLPSHISSLSH
jgi:hypothetical protein